MGAPAATHKVLQALKQISYLVHLWHSCCCCLFPDSDADSEKRSMRDEVEEGGGGRIDFRFTRSRISLVRVFSQKQFSSYDRSLVTTVSLLHSVSPEISFHQLRGPALVFVAPCKSRPLLVICAHCQLFPSLSINQSDCLYRIRQRESQLPSTLISCFNL